MKKPERIHESIPAFLKQKRTPAAQPPHQSKVLGGREGGFRGGEGTFLQKGSLPPPPILSYPTLIHIDDGNLAGFGVQHVHGTTQSRVKGADKPRYVDGILNVRHGHADEGFLKSAAHTGVVAGAQFQRVADTI